MSMSTWVRGVRGREGQLDRMLAVKAACEEADIGYPPELVAYFRDRGIPESEIDEHPDYLIEQLEEFELPEDCCKRVPADGETVWEVDVSKLPPDVKRLRFIWG